MRRRASLTNEGDLPLFVEHPEFLEFGIGGALTDDATAIARLAGCGRLEVDANTHALAFYRAPAS